MSEVTTGSPKYWQSLEEWRNDPEFQKLMDNEFQSSPLAAAEREGQGGWARREFLKLMGASMALTSFGCVRRPAQKIVPYVKRPHEVINGLPNMYSSSFVDGSEAFGLVVTTREGRPIKADGNEDHPANMGGMSARAHAHVLSLYDPDRLTGPIQNLQNEARTNRDTVTVKYADADAAIMKSLKRGKWAILTSSLVSPTQKKLVRSFVSSKGGRHYTWDSLSAENYVKGQSLSYGKSVAPRLVLENADYILAVNADILGTYLTPTESQRAFGRRRNPDGNMNKLVVLESVLTLTGTNADERHRIRPSQTASALAAVANELIVNQRRGRFAGDQRVAKALGDWSAGEHGLSQEALSQIANELWSHRGKSLVVAGEDLKAQIFANLLNSTLDNDGKTIDASSSPNTGFQGSTADLLELVKGIESGAIETLLIYGVNPMYAAAESLGFQKAMGKLKTAVYMGSYNDETGLFCDYVIPDHHSMEKWGDVEAQEGAVSIVQPTIRPLGDTRAFEDSIMAWAGMSGSYYDYLQRQYKNKWGGSFDSKWTEFLQKGVEAKPRRTGYGRSFRTSALSALGEPVTSPTYELQLYQTVGIRDGSMSNVSWLQEFPDVVTKICWDNYLTVSPKTASDLNLKEGLVVKLNVNDHTRTLPVHIQPGQADHTFGLALGYGRRAAGDVGNGVGVDAMSLVSFAGETPQYGGMEANISATETCVRLADTGGHHSMHSRQIVVEATLEQYKSNPEANIHRHKIFSAWSGHKYEGHKWGMTVDLSSCTGCSACVIACQSENNIPVVGKERVIHGREMHWMRIDRYHVGEPDDPNTVYMPVMCQHCDNAPCETVCPVAATTHSPEGTNDMTYNRCVGTRYCANNCPYKVRRFNFFEYNTQKSPLNLAMNPEVTVRDRGVMEKCTFCVHKIKQAKMVAKSENRDLKDGDVVTACQASCPTKAITFGDTNNPESAVSASMKDKRNYALLEELNVRPAVHYKTSIRNTVDLKMDPGSHKKGGH